MPDTTHFKAYLLNLQTQIGDMCAKEDSSLQQRADAWTREGGGGGISLVMQGEILEQAGVNFSHVQGERLPKSATASRPELADCQFEAMGVSVVIHPRNPYVPTTHFNIRLFVATHTDGQKIWWFGGGFDLTPYYVCEEDYSAWHHAAKAACDPTDLRLYPKFKAWCDNYFYLNHRQEHRGIGGIFFDDFNDYDFATCQAFVERVGQAFINAYKPIVAKHKDKPYGKRERDFQLYRRGRYVEFNLVYDRGTLFGLQTGGRTESILMSLPPEVRFAYNYHPESHTPEAELTNLLSGKPKAWFML